MLVDNYSSVRDNFKSYFKKVVDDNQTVIITRKDGKNAVIMSLDEYNNLKEAVRKYTYLRIMDHISDKAKEDAHDIKIYEKNL